MKQITLLLFLAMTFSTTMAQTDDNADNTNQTQKDEEGDVYSVVEEIAEYPGGLQALMQFLSENIHYPVEAEKQGITGRVLCSFIVNTDGTVSDVKIKQSVHPLLDQEALRVVNMLKGWTPAKANGHVVKMLFTLPITFCLPQKDEKPTDLPPASQPSKSPVVAIDYNSNVALGEPATFAKFPGGTEALLKYLKKNIKYPRGAEIYGISGRVVCTFIVEKDGSISDVKVARSVHPSLDKEAVRIISTMPKWTPAMQNGKPVRTRYNLPVTFTMQSKKRN